MRSKIRIIVVASLVVLAGILGVAYNRVQRQNAAIRQLEQQKVQAESELQDTKGKYHEAAGDRRRLQDKAEQQQKRIDDLNRQLQAKKAMQESLARAALNTATGSAPVYAGAGSDSLSQWLYKLRMCESGGNYRINTGNGFYGAYQFMDSTWDHWNTGYARADLAPPAVQDATIIKNTRASSGGLATQNPGCYQKTGISQFPPG